jgi:hypothetical protein
VVSTSAFARHRPELDNEFRGADVISDISAFPVSRTGRVAKFVMFGAFGLVALGAILFTALGVAMQVPAPQTEVTNRQPFADYIGREYRVVGNVSALAWNDFPTRTQSSRSPSCRHRWFAIVSFRIRNR